MEESGATPVTPGAEQATSGGSAADPSTSSYKDAVRKWGEQLSPSERQRGRLEHVKEIADGLAATSTRLQAAARKSQILLRVEAARSAPPVSDGPEKMH
ncbi:hypothetical protein PsorP6_017270 [Peronosclerospora sorghi]|uniref:Uncharacterized protein n=1 Tax=Peronosclerospora sorghi TaxID=230839 RepID=A0ACC0WLB5_9STRA|nr:hypothetical protein PsorP6_017270 [Peronosclerospora sorghi]